MTGKGHGWVVVAGEGDEMNETGVGPAWVDVMVDGQGCVHVAGEGYAEAERKIKKSS